MQGTPGTVPSSKRLLHILLIEDSNDDAQLILREIRQGGYNISYSVVDNRDALVAALSENSWDAVISDYALPQFTGLAALEIVQKIAPDLPFLIISGTIGEETAVATMKAGAHDYIMKGNLSRLVPALERELRDAEMRRKKRLSEESHGQSIKNLELSNQRFEIVTQATNDMVWDWDIVTNKTWRNSNFQTLFKFPPDFYSEEESAWRERVHPEDRERVVQGLQAVVNGASQLWNDQYRFQRFDGTYAHVLDRGYLILDKEGRPIRMIGAMTDITERVEAEETLRRKVEFERLITTISKNFINVSSEHLDDEINNTLKTIGMFADADRTYVILPSPDLDTGRTAHEWCNQGVQSEIDRMHIRPADNLPWIMERLKRFETVLISRVSDLPPEAEKEKQAMLAGNVQSLLLAPLSYGSELIGTLGCACSREEKAWSDETVTLVRILGDILANALQRKRSEDNRVALEEQLRQAQKIEAIGQLAGGVAHDFNNILMAITSYSELLLMKLPPSDPLIQEVLGIGKAAQQGIGLSRQLLAFSRKQVLLPQVVDLNHILSNLKPMLRRLIREDIELIFLLSPEIGVVKADPGQIGQAIMNLIVNARDAMHHSGTIKLETSNATLDQEFANHHLGSKVGEYVLVSVIDNGTGMEEKTLSRIFEPFFTTKEQGKGTGLGLSTVYGIVKQSGGYITVESEISKGTTFRIYLPRVDEKPMTPNIDESIVNSPTGSETILLVDDNEAVRTAVGTFLQMHGYEVIQAPDGEKALELFKQKNKPIHMLITDLVMPKMSGRQLAEQISSDGNGIKILYMSGYTEEPSLRSGTFDRGSAFLQKPASMENLLRRVRQLLDTR